MLKFLQFLEDSGHEGFCIENGWGATQTFAKWQNLLDYKEAILDRFCNTFPILPIHCQLFLNDYLNQQLPGDARTGHHHGRKSVHTKRLMHGTVLKARTGELLMHGRY